MLWLCIAVATSSMTPASVPPVTIHALASLAARTKPASNARLSHGLRSKVCAPPVTDIRTSGFAHFQYFSTKLPSIAAELMSASEMNFACVSRASKRIVPNSAVDPSCLQKTSGPKLAYIRYLERMNLVILAAALERLACSSGA